MTLYLFERKTVGKIPIVFFHLLLLDACDGGVARKKYEVIKEGWFDSERASNGVRGERDAGGGSGGGRKLNDYEYAKFTR